jgi:hypothetical protein
MIWNILKMMDTWLDAAAAWWVGFTEAPSPMTEVWSDGTQRVYLTHVCALDPVQYGRWPRAPESDPARVEQLREQFLLNDTRLVPGVISVWENPGFPRK